MGFNPLIASNALKRTNNDVNAALQLVNDDEFISQVVSQCITNIPAPPPSGSTESSAQNETGGESSSSPNNVPGSSGFSNNSSLMHELTQMAHFLSEELSDDHLPTAETERSQKAYDALSKDMCSEADYIDLNLESENSYIRQYKGLLHM